MRYPHPAQNEPKSRSRRGFTLTELLIVVAIIAVLASLITAAAINAMRNARRARILLEMKVMSQALEDLKNDVGAFPPNVFPAGDTQLGLTSDEVTKNFNDLRSFISKASNRSAERDNVETLSNYGLSPAESLVFWLQGFSSDEQRPLSGNDLTLTSVDDGNGGTISDIVTIDSFKPRYDFDRGRLRISRKPDGAPRILDFTRANGDPMQVLLYEYLAAGSEKPYLYFDTSRYTPYQIVSPNVFPSGEFFFKDREDSTSFVVAMKRLKPGAPKIIPNGGDELQRYIRQQLQYVAQGKFQLLHPGLDDAWGDFGAFEMKNTSELPQLVYPDGPFTGDVADTLTSFVDGPLADAQENK